jgi:hypothetical protein
MNLPRLLSHTGLLTAACLLQGCVPVLTGAITYDAAVSAQTHAAYAEYLLDAQEKNKSLGRAGQAPQPILTEPNWIGSVYEPSLDYADYFTEASRTNAPPNQILLFDAWKETEYPKLLAQRRARAKQGLHAPPN